ncbi:hypothetical protein [Flammeovirga kamogawensis]|uniref:TetR/AcrR family transcriptional regulator n=1 Tax=Flammeovirga kamogawensis TaxID=373891 RepID=A0ABX8GTD4_9BACT|nr:hypothetical protein [Flammeovirga kamogawensis]MBB6460102.1 AcrR family transcriptional regulator [Flammeovirga kamogawensis]QWG06855.1 hypothetical protein KM029_16330 [Flammeovirga kamogawensis]TRX68677.1 hypothetical protein EO216_11325 [Flammeovirga kamogawensis]
MNKTRKNAAPTKEAMVEMSIQFITDGGEWSLRKLATHCGTTTKVFYTRFDGEYGLVDAIVKFLGERKANQYKLIEQNIEAFYRYEIDFYYENSTIVQFLESKGRGANPFMLYVRDAYMKLFNGDQNKMIFSGTVMLGVQAMLAREIQVDHDLIILYLTKGLS